MVLVVLNVGYLILIGIDILFFSSYFGLLIFQYGPIYLKVEYAMIASGIVMAGLGYFCFGSYIMKLLESDGGGISFKYDKNAKKHGGSSL